MKKTSLFFFLLFFISEQFIFAQSEKIKWYAFEDVATQINETPKSVFIDVYTDWCGWCKTLDKTTFANPVIIKLMNEYFYAVKLDAERKDTVVFNGYSFVNPNPKGFRSAHQLASSLLQGKMGYPSMVFLNDSMQLITTVQSYLSAPDLEPVLVYIGQKKYLTMPYDTFKLTYTILSSNNTVESKPKPFILNKVEFDAGKTNIKENGYNQLDSLLKILINNESLKIEIAGYTDNTGDEKKNKLLSEERAKAVFDYFTEKGINSDRMSYIGYGSLKPIADNKTKAGQIANRRIEIRYIKN